LILAHHLDGIPYRKLVRTYHLSKDQLNRTVNQLTAQLIRNNDLTAQLRPTYADGIFLADGKAFRCKRLVVGPDGSVIKQKYPRGRTMVSLMHWASHDLPIIAFGESEDEVVWTNAFRQAKEHGLAIQYLVADDRRACWNAALRVYPNVTIQSCHAHFLRDVEQKLAYRNIAQRIGKLEKQLDRLWTSVERPGFLIGKRKAVRIVNMILEIERRSDFVRAFVWYLGQLLASATVVEWDARWSFMTETWFPAYDRLAPDDPYRKKIQSIWRKVMRRRDELFACLRFPEAIIPRTTNALEGWHNQIELRDKSIRGFESPETGDDYHNALTIWRRFRRFTDCRGGFKHLNGQGPLEAAGVNCSAIRNWILHCLKK